MNSASLLPVLEAPAACVRQAFAGFWVEVTAPRDGGPFSNGGQDGLDDHDLWFLGSPYHRLGPSHSAASSCLESSYG